MAFTPSATAFSLPLHFFQLPHNASDVRSDRKRRKKDSSDWGDDEQDAASDDMPSSSLILSPEEAHQYRIAGLSFNKELPKGGFPHAPVGSQTDRRRYPSQRKTQTDVLNGLSSLSAPVYPPQSPAYEGVLRLQHLAVLTAILHRSLLRGDYIRAGRAWGLLMREDYAGHTIDVRAEGRWGIGAEILLRQGRQISDLSSGLRGSGTENVGIPRLQFTRKGFEEAKDYYERLIIHYPHRRALPDAVSSLNFYPAMFGLWVYVTQEESKMAREHLHRNDEDSDVEDFSGKEESPEDEDHVESRQRRHSLMAESRATELEQAQQIAARMDEIVVSPPYSDSPELLELRGMVSLWIADLFLLSVPQEKTESHDSMDDSDIMDAEVSAASIQARRERRIAIEKKKAEEQKSSKFFERARARGKGVTPSLENLHIDDMDSPMTED